MTLKNTLIALAAGAVACFAMDYVGVIDVTGILDSFFGAGSQEVGPAQ